MLVLLLSFVFMIAYTAVGAPLAFTMLAYALLWRNDRALRAQQASPAAGRPGGTDGRPGCHGGSPRLTRVSARDALPRPQGGRHRATSQDQAKAQDQRAGPGPARRSQAGQPRRARPAGGVARGGALNLAGALVAAVTTLAVTVLVTRHFSKPVAGAFFTAISLFLIVEAVAEPRRLRRARSTSSPGCAAWDTRPRSRPSSAPP